VEVFFAVTTALDTTAAVSSVTVPTIEPYKTCAETGRTAVKRTRMVKAARHAIAVAAETQFAMFTGHLHSGNSRILGASHAESSQRSLQNKDSFEDPAGTGAITDLSRSKVFTMEHLNTTAHGHTGCAANRCPARAART
jgi:hypothetical protein